MLGASNTVRGHGLPQVPALPQPAEAITVAQYNEKRGFGLKAPPKISVLSAVFRDTPAPWIALDGVCIEVPPAHHYEQAAGKAAGWSGFRAIVFGPDWRIASDTCYSCYYPPNEMQQMRMDFSDIPLGSYVLVATGDATCNSDGSDVENTTAAMQYLGADAFLREHKQSKMRCSYIGLLHKSKPPVYEDALGKMSSSLCAVIVPPHAAPPSISGHGLPQVPALPQPVEVITVAQYNEKRGFGLKAPPKISILSAVFRDTPAPWIALDGVCIEVPPAHHYEQAAGKAAGWSGFRAIVFGPDWRIASDTCYSCYYPPNETQQMKEDFCYIALGSYVLVATGDATCNSDGSDVENITIAMGHLGAPKFLKEHQQSRMRCSYVALLHKGLKPVYEDALGKMSSSLCAVITAPFVPVTQTASGHVFSGGAKGFMWPLSDAISQRASVSDIIDILDSHPNCIYECDAPDGHGVSALDLALFHRTHEDVLTQIVRRNPALLAVQQGQGHGGLWPIHRIAINITPRGACLSLAFLNECISLNPRCTSYRSADNVTALFKAMRLKPPSHDVILTLLAADLPVLPNGTHNAHYAGALHDILDANSPLDPQFVRKLVQAIFSTHPNIAHDLANSVDAAGRRAMNIAHKDVRLLIQSFIFFCGRYEIAKGAPLHRSGTSVVVLASDHGQVADATAAAAPLQVAMKFMMQHEQYDREINMRTRYNISSAHVLTIFDSFDAETDAVFAQSLQRIGMERYRFCVTMPAADRSLKSIIDSEHICGRDWDAIKLICSQLCKSLEHMHDCGVVHGDMKPLNVVRVNGRMLVIDLDASTPCSHALGYKSSSAYVPPEMLQPSQSSDLAHAIPRPRRPSDENALPASPTFDIWSLGVIFFQLFCGETLFQANDEDNLDSDGLLLLQNWGNDPAFRLKKLSKISHPMARHLLSQMLVAQPQQRLLTIAHVLSHSFFSGQPQRRRPDQRPDWDVFISYRVDADAAVVAKLYTALIACGLRVFLDSKCLKDGEPWESGFVDALCKSHCFVPILSRAALKIRFEGLSDSSPCDNVLLEYRLAIELAQRNLLTRIFPLFLGDLLPGASPQRSHYFSSGCQPNAPNAVVSAVEAKATKHLENLGLGLPFVLNMSAKDVFSGITSYQGGFIQGVGDDESLLSTHVTAIHKMIESVSHNDSLQTAAD
jgi:serine/threonine protein kinase